MSVIYGKNNEQNFKFCEGCDFVLELGSERKNDEIRILQLTDMQIIDASQRRTPDRIRHDEIDAWGRESIKGNCYNHIKSLIKQTMPDLIFITGDIVYGEFDDSGDVLKEFIDFIDFGNLIFIKFLQYENTPYDKTSTPSGISTLFNLQIQSINLSNLGFFILA